MEARKGGTSSPGWTGLTQQMSGQEGLKGLLAAIFLLQALCPKWHQTARKSALTAAQ